MRRLRRGCHLVVAILLLTAAPVSVAQSSATIAGRVVDRAGRGLPGADVSARPVGAGPLVRAVSGEDGTYRLERLAAGTYRVTVSLDGWDAARDNRVLVGAGATATINATLDIGVVCECIEPPARPTRRGLYIGYVADTLGHALPFAMVTITGSGLPRPERGYADAAGNYTAYLPPGSYRFTFTYPGFQTLTRDDMPAIGGWSERLNVRLEPEPAPDGAPAEQLLRIGCRCPGQVFERPVGASRSSAHD
jgi:carboxypeptidase family protein